MLATLSLSLWESSDYKLVCVSGKKLILFFSGSIAGGVPYSLNGSPYRVIAYLLSGKIPVALNAELMLPAGSLLGSMLLKVFVIPGK